MARLAKKQSGAVLMIALVILGITTLLGVAVMQGATQETKMATNNQERQQAFNAAEAALRVAEYTISTVGYTATNLYTSCDPAVNPPCFTNTCTDGLCFLGVFDTGNTQLECQVANGTPLADGVWGDATLNVWNTVGRHQTVTLAGYPPANNPKYIIEFQCFTDQIPDAFGNAGLVDDGGNGSGDVMYRITARGTSKSGRMDVMLQSTFRAPNPM